MTVHSSMFTYIAARDKLLMKRLNAWRPPRWIRLWMIAATRLGDGWLWYSMGLIVLLFGGPDRYLALGAAALASGAGILLFIKVKRVCNRTRPSSLEPHCWATLLPPDRFSFPSGHSITAFAVAIPLGWFYPALMLGLVFCALSIASSRVLLGLHYLSDVVAGCAIGIALGFTAVALIA